MASAMSKRPIEVQTIVVTGGNRGIGLGLVHRFLERPGNTVIATTRRAKDAAQLVQLQQEVAQGRSHKGLGSRLHVSELDLLQPQAVNDWAASLSRSTGVKHIDILINNAGVYGRRLGFTELEPEDFLVNFKTNTLAPFLVTQQLYKQGLIGPPGTVVMHVSSIVASHGDQKISSITKGGYAYRASKAGLNMVAKVMALDLEEQGVTTCAVYPGYVVTEMNDGKGWITVEESSQGLVSLLESGQPLSGRFLSYDGTEIPW